MANSGTVERTVRILVAHRPDCESNSASSAGLTLRRRHNVRSRALPATQGVVGWLGRGMLGQVSPNGGAEAGCHEHGSGFEHVPNRSAGRKVANIQDSCQTS